MYEEYFTLTYAIVTQQFLFQANNSEEAALLNIKNEIAANIDKQVLTYFRL